MDLSGFFSRVSKALKYALRVVWCGSCTMGMLIMLLNTGCGIIDCLYALIMYFFMQKLVDQKNGTTEVFF